MALRGALAVNGVCSRKISIWIIEIWIALNAAIVLISSEGSSNEETPQWGVLTKDAKFLAYDGYKWFELKES